MIYHKTHFQMRYLLLLSFLLYLFGCHNNTGDLQTVKKTQILMDTFVEITVVSDDRGAAEKAIDSAFNELGRIERLMTRFNPDSEVSKINDSAGARFVEVSDDLYEVIKKSISISDKTDGLFDISVGVLMEKFWNFNNGLHKVPDRGEITKYLPLINYKKIKIKGNNMIHLNKKGMAIDVGAIAKGYAIDKGMEVLKKAGIKNALINAGGDLVTEGGREPGKSWRVGIQHPRYPSKLLGVLAVNKSSVATSGDYQRYTKIDGIRYHHIINPKTGWPAQGNQSVTIIAGSVMDADAIATAVFVMDPASGISFIQKMKGVEGIIVSSEGKIIVSPGLLDTFSLKE